MIYHAAPADAWSSTGESYRPTSLDSEGFIHCSTPEQAVKVANLLFHGQKGLVLLLIDPEVVKPEIRYEGYGDGELFPHIYGPLNIDAVLKVLDFEPEEDGNFKLPEEISQMS